MPRPKKTEQEIKAMRERILNAALTLLQQEGLESVSIRKIADRIGVSHMVLYSYFENRAAIIQSLRERGFERMEAFCIESLRRAETGDALIEVRALLERFIHLSHEYPRLYQLAWRRAPSLRVDSQNVTRILEYLSRLIQLCMERGQCIERDLTLAAVMVFSIVNGTLMLYHNISAIGQIAQAEPEREMIEASDHVFDKIERHKLGARLPFPFPKQEIKKSANLCSSAPFARYSCSGRTVGFPSLFQKQKSPPTSTKRGSETTSRIQGGEFFPMMFAGAAVGTMVSNWHAPRIPECRLRVDGTAGSLLSLKQAIAADDARLTIHRVEGEIEEREYSQKKAAVMNMGESMKAVLVAIDENASPHHSGRDNLQTMAIVDAAYLSASRGGEKVTIDEVWPR